MTSENTLKKLGKAGAIVFIGLVISKLFTFVYRVIMGRWLGPEEYGLFAVGFAIYGFTSLFADLGLSVAVNRFVSFYLGKNEEEKAKSIVKTLRTFTAILSIITAIALFLLSDYIAINIIGNEAASIVLKLFAIVIPITQVYAIGTYVLISLEKQAASSNIRNILESVTKVVLTALLLYFGFGLNGALLAFIGSIVLSTACTWYLVKRYNFSLSKAQNDFRHLKETLVFSLPVFANAAFAAVLSFDVIFVSAFKDVAQAGIYSAAVPIAAIIMITPTVTSNLFLPYATRLFAKNEKQKLKTVYEKSILANLAINLLLLGGIAIAGKGILRFVFGEAYATAAIPLVILSIGYVFYSLAQPAVDILLATGKSKECMVATFAASIVSFSLNYFLVPIFGITGAAISTAISFLLLAAISGYFLRKDGIVFTKQHFLLGTGILILPILLLIPAWPNDFIGLVEKIMAFIAIYCLLVFTSKAHKELALVLTQFRKK